MRTASGWLLDCMVDQQVTGICILANFSEQFLLADAERETLTRLCIEHVAGRVPVIVTVSHFSTDIVVARARHAAELGAAMLMMMAPYHGALMRGTPEQTWQQFAREIDAVVTMYHDQGQIALKLLGFDRGVSVQGGLPFPVTTPAHGTAFDIAGEGRADVGATRAAFDLACAMVGNWS